MSLFTSAPGFRQFCHPVCLLAGVLAYVQATVLYRQGHCVKAEWLLLECALKVRSCWTATSTPWAAATTAMHSTAFTIFCAFMLPTCYIHAGEKNLLDDDAVTVGGGNHSHATQDLYDAIAAGDYPEWQLAIQTMRPADEHKFDFDPLDVTKIWPEDLFPLQPVGRMVRGPPLPMTSCVCDVLQSMS